MTHTFDPSCLYLASQFLADHPDLDTSKNRKQLAQVIQQAIEAEIAAMTEDAAKAQAAQS